MPYFEKTELSHLSQSKLWQFLSSDLCTCCCFFFCFFIKIRRLIAENHQAAPLLMEQEWEAALVNSNHVVNVVSLCPGTWLSCVLLFLLRFCTEFYAVTPIHFPTPVSSLLSSCESTVGNNFFSFIFCLTWEGLMVFSNTIPIMTLTAKLLFIVGVLNVDKIFPSFILQYETTLCNSTYCN